MSIEIMTRVWRHFPYGGSRLNIALAIADFADDHGVAWPGIPTLATKARISTRQAMRITKDLQADGQLAIFPRYHSKHGGPTSNAYLVLTGMNRKQVRAAIPRLSEIGADPDKMTGYDIHLHPDKMTGVPCHGRQGDPDTGDRGLLTGVSPDPSINHQGPVKEKDHAAGAASNEGQEDDADWLKESRIEGESGLEGMTPEEKALVAAPAAPDQPEEPGAPAWETAMRKRLKGMTLPGDFTPDDVVGYCQRFYDLTSNPPPAHNKGNSNWLFGAKATIKSFHGSLVTLYESKGQAMPDIERQRRVFAMCVDLFFYVGAGYDHISAPTPRSLANSMASLIGDLVEIHTMYSINGAGIEESHIKGWVARRKGDKRGKKTQRQAGRSGRPAPTDGGVRGPGKTPAENERDLEAARRIIAGGT